jgi:hypothetical protein
MPNARMTVKDVLKQLEARGDAKVRAHNTKWGAGDNQFGVKLGDIRRAGEEDQERPRAGQGALEDRERRRPVSRGLILKPKDLSANEMDLLVRSRQIRASGRLADLLCRQGPRREGVPPQKVDVR